LADSDDNRDLFRTYLASAGFQVADAGDGENAVVMALELKPDVIVMDLALPGVDGWEATRQLKTHSQTRSVPIIVCTAFTADDAQQKAQAAGCDAFLTKPCLPDDLITEIWRVLGAAASPTKSARSGRGSL
jgi:two-component system, cell cycle response regulator DivK